MSLSAEPLLPDASISCDIVRSLVQTVSPDCTAVQRLPDVSDNKSESRTALLEEFAMGNAAPATIRFVMSIAGGLAFLAAAHPTGFQARLSAADQARQIVDESQKRTTSKTQRYEGLLQSFDEGGKTSEKRWTFERLGAHGKSKTIIRFTAPAEVRGVALLVVNHPDRASDQWMWTPALQRDRRIALQDRSTRFFGTDFSFEDLEQRDANQYSYRLLADQAIDGALCWTIESTPLEVRSSQYTKSVMWVRKDNYAVVRIDSFVGKDIVRQLKNLDVRNVQGIWTARELRMADLRRGSITRLVLEQVEYDVPLDESKFTVPGLRRP